MRLSEFTDPKGYAEIVADIEDLPNKPERIWPHDGSTFILDFMKPQGQREKVINRL